MLLYGLHHSWIGLSLCRLVAGGCLISAILQVCHPCIKYGYSFRLVAVHLGVHLFHHSLPIFSVSFTVSLHFV
jgi:hypothetical protein